MTWVVEQKDCVAGMAAMDPASVDAIVTSPPYADLRPYAGAEGPAAAAERLRAPLREMLRVVKPGGSLLLNYGRVMRGGEEQPCAFEVLALAQDLGWKWIDTIIWSKPNGFIAASTDYLHSSHEYVWWLAPEIKAYRGYDKDTRRPHAPDSLKRFKQGIRKSNSKADDRYHKAGKRIPTPHPDGARPRSVVTYSVGGRRGIKHSAPMPLDLAMHLVSLSCPPGGKVLDPFTGSGTTGIAALRRGRTFVGFEVEGPAATEARELIAADAPLFNEASGLALTSTQQED